MDGTNISFPHALIVLAFSAIICMSLIAMSMMDMINNAKWIELSISIVLLITFYFIFRRLFHTAMNHKEAEDTERFTDT